MPSTSNVIFHDYHSNRDNTKEVKVLLDSSTRSYIVEYFENGEKFKVEVYDSRSEYARNRNNIRNFIKEV